MSQRTNFRKSSGGMNSQRTTIRTVGVGNVPLAWNTNRHIFQFDGTIKWKATERSKGALKQLSKVKERQRSSLAWPISLSYELETKVRNLIDCTTSGCAR